MTIRLSYLDLYLYDKCIDRQVHIFFSAGNQTQNSYILGRGSIIDL